MTLGIVATSILSGHVVAATGRYRWWPVVGTLVAAAGLWMLSRITPDTGRLQITVGMIVLGLGVGCIVQLMVVVVQNAVSMRDLGVATSTTGVSRIVGGAVGTGLFGAILASRIGDAVAEHLPANALPPGVDPAFLARQPAMAAQMPPPVRDGLAAAYADVFSAIFTAAIPLALLAFVAALLIPQLPMRVRFDPDQVEAEPPPSDEVALD
jgi:MFS family permease